MIVTEFGLGFLIKELFLDVFLTIEIHVETRVQRVFNDTKELLELCKNRGLKIAIVSDFYIPMPYFKKLFFHF